MKESISQHVTGLPPSLLRLFEARPQPRHLDPIRKRKPLLPYSGVAEYVQQFAEPGDPEYEPPPSESRPPEPRVFRAPEYALQARVEVHTRPERCGVTTSARLPSRSPQGVLQHTCHSFACTRYTHRL